MCAQATWLSVDMVVHNAFSLQEVLAETVAAARNCLGDAAADGVLRSFARPMCTWLRAEEIVQGSAPSLHNFHEVCTAPEVLASQGVGARSLCATHSAGVPESASSQAGSAAWHSHQGHVLSRCGTIRLCGRRLLAGLRKAFQPIALPFSRPGCR